MTTIDDDPAHIPDEVWGGLMSEQGRQDPYPILASVMGPACSHAAALQALRDPRWHVVGAGATDRVLWRFLGRCLISLNPPEHTVIRRRLSRAFTKTAVESYRPHVEATLHGILDGLVPRGRCDLVAEFAFRLPTAVISDLMDLPPAVREGLDGLLVDLGRGFIYRDDPAAFDRGEAAVVEIMARLRPLLAERAEHPGDDLLSRLAGTSEQNERDEVEFDDLVVNAAFLLHAGHETTQNAIASAVYALLTHPQQLAAVRADLDLVPAVVEEALRLHSPIGVAPRKVSEDVELAQWHLRAGTVVPFFLGAANRDPQVFADPDRFDMNRDASSHLAFSSGAHLCLGAPLARLEVQLAIEGVLTRMPGLRLESQPRWHGVIPFRGLERLDVSWGR